MEFVLQSLGEPCYQMPGDFDLLRSPHVQGIESRLPRVPRMVKVNFDISTISDVICCILVDTTTEVCSLSAIRDGLTHTRLFLCCYRIYLPKVKII